MARDVRVEIYEDDATTLLHAQTVTWTDLEVEHCLMPRKDSVEQVYMRFIKDRKGQDLDKKHRACAWYVDARPEKQPEKQWYHCTAKWQLHVSSREIY